MDNQAINEFRQNFHKVFYKSVVPALKPLDNERIKTRRTSNIIGIIISVIANLFVICLLKDDIGFPNGNLLQIIFGCCFIIVLLTSVIMFFVKEFMKKNFEYKLKNQIMPVALKAFGDFRWTTSEIINKSELENSGIISYFEYMDIDDNFAGSYKGIPIRISEMELYYKDEDSEGRERNYTSFKGIVIKLGVLKHFKYHTIVKPKELINSGPYEEVKLEDPEFAKKFHVRSQDQVEARYLLTTAFMERFKNIQKTFEGKTISCSFLNNTLLIAIPIKKDLFALGDLNKPVTETTQYEIFLNELISIFELIEELKLYENTGL